MYIFLDGLFLYLCMIYIYIQFFFKFFMYRIQNSIIDHQRWDYASNYTLFKQRICSGFGALKTSRKKLSIEGSTRKRIGRFTKNKFMAGHRILISDIFWYVLMMFLNSDSVAITFRETVTTFWPPLQTNILNRWNISGTLICEWQGRLCDFQVAHACWQWRCSSLDLYRPWKPYSLKIRCLKSI